MECKKIKKLIIESLGDISNFDDTIKVHITSCKECKDEYEVYKDLIKCLKAQDNLIDPGESYWNNFEVRFHEKIKGKESQKGLKWGIKNLIDYLKNFKVSLQFSYGLALLIILLIFLYKLNNYNPDSNLYIPSNYVVKEDTSYYDISSLWDLYNLNDEEDISSNIVIYEEYNQNLENLLISKKTYLNFYEVADFIEVNFPLSLLSDEELEILGFSIYSM